MQNQSEYNERTWLVQLANGNEKAFDRLVDRYWNKIYSVALTYIKSPSLAEDLVQDVFLKLWQKRETLAAIESLEDYLFIITRNAVISALRKKGPKFPVGDYLSASLPANEFLPEQQLQAKQLEQIINQAIALLPPQQQQALRLSREEGRSHDEIASLMALSKNTVKNHIVRALNFVRDYIQSQSDTLLTIAILFSLQNF